MNFFDTSALLIADQETLNKKFYISYCTLVELESIKTSQNKSEEIKMQARHILRWLFDHPTNYIVEMKSPIEFLPSGCPDNMDSKIIASALLHKECIFLTEDLSCLLLAQSAGLNAQSLSQQEQDNKERYTGFKIVNFEEEELSSFYNNEFFTPQNIYNLCINEYIFLSLYGEVIDKYKWTGEKYEKILEGKLESDHFGKIVPRDDYQKIALDSLKTNQITLLGGPAGSGKTMLSLAYLFEQLEKHNIDRIIIFCNPAGARNAVRLGFYKGTVRDKILATQVGHVLSSKLGDMSEVEHLMDEEILQIIPAVDARGYEVPPHSGVYILESQNLTSDLLRLLLQRVGEDSKVIIDGDRFEQLDMEIYERDNGLRKLSEVFRNHKIFGQVDLQRIYRSEIAKLAEEMK